jgi:hydroxymethylglutaryl-CoA lyase
MSRQRVFITDVAPRDGLQNQAVMVPAQQKIRLIRALAEAGMESIEATSFVSPKAVPQMADASEVMSVAREITGLCNIALVPNRKGLERAAAVGTPAIAVVLSVTNTMNQRNINMDLREATVEALSVVRAARELGMRTRAYLAVAFECPFEGKVAPDAVRSLARMLADAGTDEIVLADTIGAAAPSDVSALVSTVSADVPLDRIALHLHDTRGMAVANAWAGLQAGVRRFDSSIGGIGGCPFAPGASGNVATEDLVLLCEQSGYETGIRIDAMMQAVSVAESILDRPLGGKSAAWFRKSRAKLV